MATSAPCTACLEQLTKRVYDRPHNKLALIDTKIFRGAMTGGHEEYTYECRACGSIIHHMHDKNDFMPFWSFVENV